MDDGVYIFYVIEAKRISETKNSTDTKFYSVDWSWSASEFEEYDPWNKDKYGHKLYRKSSDDKHLCWAKTGYNTGWFNLDYARAALKRAKTKKYFVDEDGYGKVRRKAKYKFRIKKITIMKAGEILEC